MYQIALGDDIAGYTVIDGASIAPPFVKSTVYFTFSVDSFIQEHIDIQLKGTSAQIASALATLELVIQRSLQYDNVLYVSPQFLRFKVEADSNNYYTPITNVYLSTNPAAYLTQPLGSRIVTLHYTRPNYFDGPQTNLPLTGRGGTDITTGYPLVNHTDSGVGHGSTALIKKANMITGLPAPLRVEYKFNVLGGAVLKSIFVGVYHHPTYDGDVPFFFYYDDLAGGTNIDDPGAIQGYYKTISWTSAAWQQFTYGLVDLVDIDYLNGASYRPIIHLFSPHAYDDLYFRVQVQRFSQVLFVSEPVYSPPGYGYITLPPIQLPPNYLLREEALAKVHIYIYALRESGALTSVDIDCLTLFPLHYAASFNAFITMSSLETLVDDSHRNRFNVWNATTEGETISHARVGGPLLLFPGSNSRLFFYCTRSDDLMPIAYSAILKVYYRPRIRLL